MVIKTRIYRNKNEKLIALIKHGNDLRYIQELLGPKSLKIPIKSYRLNGQATQIYPVGYTLYIVYTHVTQTAKNKIVSPIN